MRIFKTKFLARYARRERIADRNLSEAIERAGRGLIDADLGGGIIKQRVARSGQGPLRRLPHVGRLPGWNPRRVPLRVAKSERDNIGSDELLALREIGAAWLDADAQLLAQALEDGRLQEVTDGEDDKT